MSARGSASSRTRSASLPGSTVPRLARPRNRAGLRVAVWRASSGVSRQLAQVLDARLPGLNGFRNRHGERHVSGKGQAPAPGFLGNGEVGVPRQVVVDLEEVHSAALEVRHGCAGLLGVAHFPAEWPVGRRVVEDEAGRDDPRPHVLPMFHSPPHLQGEIQVAPHVSYAGHSQGQVEERQRRFPFAQVGVHVPESRDQVLPRSVDHPRPRGHLDAARSPHRGDLSALDEDRLVRLARRARRIDRRDVNEEEGRSRGGGGCRSRCRQEEQAEEGREKSHGFQYEDDVEQVLGALSKRSAA